MPEIAAQRRRLPRAVRAEEGHHFARSDMQIDVAQDGSAVVASRQPFDGEHWFGVHRSPPGWAEVLPSVAMGRSEAPR